MPTEGVDQASVDAIRREVEAAIQDTVSHLRSIEAEAQLHLRQAITERQHLEAFLDELQYRLKKVAASDEPIVTITGPLSESQISAWQSQGDNLAKRREDLDHLNAEMEQLSSRLSWLVHQIEGACDWVLTPIDGDPDGDQGDQGRARSAGPGDQVMWAQVIMGQEAERARLAREIHDGPAQVLANTVMRLQFVEQLTKQQPESVPAEMARLRSAIQASLRDVRRFIFNLRPASLTDAGLVPTLRIYTQDYEEQFGVPLELNLPENLVLSANQELSVFRIIQEALQNIHKHAEASRIEVSIQQPHNRPTVVTIVDDGKGFDPKAARRSRPTSSGLVSMRERAATVGGTLKIDSRPGLGTTVTLVLPISKSQ